MALFTNALLKAVTLAVVLPILTACTTHVEVWERGNLASRVMMRNASATQAALEQHTYTSKESTAGGYGVGAGGCGCN